MEKIQELKEKLKKRLNADGKIALEDLVEVSVLALFVLQKLGKASQQDIATRLDTMGALVNEHLLAQALDALQAKGFISYATGRGAKGQSQKMWRLRRVCWAAPPEVAHISDLLPNLVSTPEAETLISSLNEQEKKGDGTQKAKRDLVYDHYVDVRASFITLDELLGSQPGSPWLDELCDKSPHNGVEAERRFWRDSETGALVLGSDAVRGWLRTGLRSQGFADSVAEYLGVSKVMFAPAKPLKQTAIPIIDRGDGKGLMTYETVEPLQPIVIDFRLPTKGFMTPEQFRAWLAGYAPKPIRGISPARGARFGRMALVGFEVLGSTAQAGTFVRSAMTSDLPEAARAFYETIAADADENGLMLRRS